MNKYVRKVLKQYYCKILYKINSEKYKKVYPTFLKKLGINISPNHFQGGHGFIAPDVLFDGSDFSLISIGKNTTISTQVIVLTHDFSISKGLQLLHEPDSGKFLKPVSIGENCFVGLRTILLPGTSIGDNVVIGAGAVVKGIIPDNVVVAGNPAKILCSTDDWARRHCELHDYVELM